MGLYDNVYLYAAVIPPTPDDDWPQTFRPLPIITPEAARERIDYAIRALDEFEIMRALDALDDAARKRVLEWLNARVKP